MALWRVLGIDKCGSLRSPQPSTRHGKANREMTGKPNRKRGGAFDCYRRAYSAVHKHRGVVKQIVRSVNVEFVKVFAEPFAHTLSFNSSRREHSFAGKVCGRDFVKPRETAFEGR